MNVYDEQQARKAAENWYGPWEATREAIKEARGAREEASEATPQTYGGRPEFKRLSESMERPVYDRRPSARLEADAAQANDMQQMRDKADASERINVHGAPPLGQNTSREAADNLAGQGKTLVDTLWEEEHGE
jgi:hypothetical protein